MRRWRVGTISMGLLLIALGVVLLIAQTNRVFALEQIMKWWPVVLVILGVETLAYVALSGQEEPKVKFDIFSIFIIAVIMIFSLGAFTVTTLMEKDVLARILPVFNISKYETTIKKDFTVEPDGKNKLVLENRLGDIDVVKGHGEKVEIEAVIRIRNNDENYAREISDSLVKINQSNVVSIKSELEPYISNKAMIQGISINYTIRVPGKTSINEIHIDNSFGKVNIEEIYASTKVECKHGDVTAKSVTGNLEVKNSFGCITAEGVKGDTRLENNNGEITIKELSGTLYIKSRFCPIKIENVGGSVDVTGNNGDIITESLNGDVKIRNEFGSVKVVNACKKIDIDNKNGDITVETDKMVEKDVNLNNQFGGIVLNVSKEQKGYFKAHSEFGSIDNNLGINVQENARKKSMEGNIGSSSVRFNLDSRQGNIKIEAR